MYLRITSTQGDTLKEQDSKSRGINVMKESTHGNANLPTIIQATKHVRVTIKKVMNG